jgi:UPF0755 protein
MTKRSHKKSQLLVLLSLILFVSITAIIYLSSIIFLNEVKNEFGLPDSSLNTLKKINLSIKLFMNKDLILNPVNAKSDQTIFGIQPEENAQEIANRLEADGYIADSSAFVDYLIYKGYDRLINSGEFYISSSINAMDIAEKIHSSTGDLTSFTILAGWRVEEIARAMDIYQFPFQTGQLINVVHHPDGNITLPDGLHGFKSLEGLLLPRQYKVDKKLSIGGFLSMTLDEFNYAVTPKIRKAFQKNGLSLEQAVILASIVEKEAILPKEGPIIASVFYNRLAAGMKLESDPTVQYAIGYVQGSKTWWKNPLSLTDLQIDSGYNTYQNSGLPPAPICNPGLSALNSVAFPASTNYYYFRAACDSSGKHSFSTTFEEHLKNACQ